MKYRSDIIMKILISIAKKNLAGEHKLYELFHYYVALAQDKSIK